MNQIVPKLDFGFQNGRRDFVDMPTKAELMMKQQQEENDYATFKNPADGAECFV